MDVLNYLFLSVSMVCLAYNIKKEIFIILNLCLFHVF